ncbi:MAG: ribosome small subunit-dependent GTPase A [Spirochaetota bacterium]|nr:ribosome small subunit-dependent GTPase A [Spirochaetota bacterium]
MKDVLGMIIKIYGAYYTVQWNNKKINCVLRGRIRKDKEMLHYSNPAAVGDFVRFDLNNDGTGVINEIQTRRNIFSRKEKGKNRKEDIIASNLDHIVIIQSFNNPKFNFRFVDRIIVRGEKEGIGILLCINKIDLANRETIKYIKNYYAEAKIGICMVSAITGEGMNDLTKLLKGKVSLFVGSSGVGKTSAINYLNPGLKLRTSDVSIKTRKGKHTTANVEMIIMPNETFIIDTPGVKEFGLMDIEPHELGQYFSEFRKYADLCEFKPCTHDHEPSCEVKRQVDMGNIYPDRYISYLNILYSLIDYYKSRY